MSITATEFAQLCEALLRADNGVSEDIYTMLMGLATRTDNQEALAILLRADATDGMFYL